jgi:hypothetical protein
MERKFQEFQEKQNQMLQQMSNLSQISKKGKGKGKSSKTFPASQNLDFNAAVQAEAQKRLRSFVEHSEASSFLSADLLPGTSQQANKTPSVASNWTEDFSNADPNPEPSTKTIFIRKIEVLLNGSPIDQVFLP